MPKITFIQNHSGEERTIEASVGLSLMEAAVRHNIPGIDAECGGACACATCHVYVSQEWRDRMAPPSANESMLVEFAEGYSDESRLSCQIPITDALDGLRVRLPEGQG